MADRVNAAVAGRSEWFGVMMILKLGARLAGAPILSLTSGRRQSLVLLSASSGAQSRLQHSLLPLVKQHLRLHESSANLCAQLLTHLLFAVRIGAVRTDHEFAFRIVHA